MLSSEEALLRDAGYETERFEVTNAAISGPVSALAAAAGAAYSRKSYEEMRKRIGQFRPDILHVHNFFPLLSPSIHFAARDSGVGVVQTLHNYRFTCVNAQLIRNHRPCELCVGRSPWPGVVHACYRGSRLASLGVANMIRSLHKSEWIEAIDRFLVLSDFAKGIFQAAGLPAEKIRVVPNSAPASSLTADRKGPFLRALFVGRLSEEKGIQELVNAWITFGHPKAVLRVAGDGPLKEKMLDIPGVTLLGAQSSASVAREMAEADVLLVPSIWYEGFPMVVAEAFAAGLPVFASNLGSLAEIVREGHTGRLLAPGDAAAWGDALRSAVPSELKAFGENARREYEAKYSPTRKLANLVKIYGEVRKGDA